MIRMIKWFVLINIQYPIRSLHNCFFSRSCNYLDYPSPIGNSIFNPELPALSGPADAAAFVQVHLHKPIIIQGHVKQGISRSHHE